jgi:hypothetical protein
MAAARERITPAKCLTMTLAVLLLAGVALMLLLRGCSGPPVIMVVNDSGANIHSLVLEGDGFSVVLPDMVPGGSETTIVHPSGESSLKISLQLEDRAVTKDDLTYIEPEGGYMTIVTVQRGGQIECQTRTGFSWRRAL